MDSNILRPCDLHRNKFLYNKTNRGTNFPNLFCQETLHVSGSSSAHHQDSPIVHSALIYVMQVWWPLSSRTRMEHPGPAWKRSSNLHDIYQCRVYNGRIL